MASNHDDPTRLTDVRISPLPGTVLHWLGIALCWGGTASAVHFVVDRQPEFLGGILALVALGVFLIWGVSTVPPDKAAVVIRRGRYVGTVRTPGCYWVGPFTQVWEFPSAPQVTSSSSGRLLDRDGLPVDVEAFVSWRHADVVRAFLYSGELDSHVRYRVAVTLQRVVAGLPLAPVSDGAPSLRTSVGQLESKLRGELAPFMEHAGLEIIEVRVSGAAPAKSAESVLLRPLLAGAVVSARRRVAEGAVETAEAILARLERNPALRMERQERASLLRSLLIVLSSERDSHPVQPVDGAHAADMLNNLCMSEPMPAMHSLLQFNVPAAAPAVQPASGPPADNPSAPVPQPPAPPTSAG